jgi:LuxR family transcriptional regulator, glucitol operon activator
VQPVPFSATRMIVFALLSSVEEDLRRVLQSLTEDPPLDVLGEDLAHRALKRLSDDRGAVQLASCDLDMLLPYTDLGDLQAVISRQLKGRTDDVAKHIASHNVQLSSLLPVRKRIAHVRPLDYQDFTITDSTTEHLCAERSDLWMSTAETRSVMDSDPSFIYTLPQPRYEEDDSRVFYRLPLPDFDDTGFLGRDEELRKLLDLCAGPWPVVSVIGEGGLGKSALALRAAYDLIDAETPAFEAIIFSTSKNAQLTPSQIRELNNDVKDAIGLLGDAASAFGSGTGVDPIEDLLMMMSSYKVLLVLDNLENVIDQTIRDFLDRLPMGSKVLVTSRIGLGDYEKRLPLSPMSSADAVRLLRTYARVSGVPQLHRLDQEKLLALCQRMKNNPLFIKWFVGSVQAGKSPEAALNNPETFLDYCLSNVYGYLSTSARDVLRVLQASPDELSLAEATFLNGDDLVATQQGLQELLVTNMVSMNVQPHGAVCDAQYELGELARMYLTRHHPLPIDYERRYRSRVTEMHDVRERMRRRVQGSSLEPKSISVRSHSDLLVAKHLREAQQAAEIGDFDSAFRSLHRSKALAPDFFECYRIEAQLQSQARNHALAQEAFTVALEMNPQSAPLKAFYAEFLLEARSDADGALEQIEKALALEPRDPELLQRHVQLSLRLLGFKAAAQSIAELERVYSQRSAMPLDVWQLVIESPVKEALFTAETGDLATAIALLEQVKREFELAPALYRRRLVPLVERSAGAAFVCHHATDPGVAARSKAFLDWLSSRGVAGPRVLSKAWPLSEERRSGHIKKLITEKAYGFISVANEADLFFHRDDLQDEADWERLLDGTPVTFTLAATDQRRWRATFVSRD